MNTPKATLELWGPTWHPSYEVSNLGRVRSLRYGKTKILKTTLSKGYPSLHFYIDGKRVSQRVHRLVAAAFLGPCPEGHETLHLDDNPANPRLDNLRYGTHQENCNEALYRGRLHVSKLVPRQIANIRRIYANGRVTQTALAEAYRVSQSTISAILRGKKWK